MSDLPRYTKLPLFDPHRKAFRCVYQDQHVPPLDPQAELWYEQALALDDPNIWYENRDWKKIYQLYVQATERNHWKAMLNLASLILSSYPVPEHEPEVAIRWVEKAMTLGVPDAAEKLGFIYARANTAEAKLRALRVMHEGSKLGSADCAHGLASEFDGFNLTNGRNLPGYVDKDRSTRYQVLGDALEFWQGRLKLPNLDKVLPLPPAPLPKWDGNKQTLIDAAKAVTAPAKPDAASGAALQGREQMLAGHGVLPLAQSPYSVTGDRLVPETGYWLALFGTAKTPREKLASARGGRPERYQAGERFEPARIAGLLPETVQWHYLGQPRPLPPSQDDFLGQMVRAGWMRQVPATVPLRQCSGHRRCPQEGIWEARVADSHPLAKLFNTWTQQAFVQEGRIFPDPRARSIDVERHDVMWTYLGSPNVDGAAPGVRNISL